MTIRRIRRRLAAMFLHFAPRTRLVTSVYYAMFARRFVREQHAVLTGGERFAETDGPGGGTSTKLRRNVHRLEKGLIMQPLRSVFALEYIEETTDAYRGAVVEANGEATGELAWARDVLGAYFDACGPHELVTRLGMEFAAMPRIGDGCAADRASSLQPYVRRLEGPAPVEYGQLLRLAERRRSVRWFQQRSVPRELVEKAVMVAGLSPSACNRQPFEFRFFDEPGLLRKVAALPGGTSGFHENFPLVGVVVGSLAHYFDERDRHLIYIDGGLATMSLILALETLGLSSCCINWPDIEEAEGAADRVLGLKPYERPVMFLAVGYPDPKAMVPYSEKKSVSQLCRWNVRE